MRGTWIRRTARRGCWSGWRRRWSATTLAPPPWEGLAETPTVQRLGLTGALQRTLRSTNSIENLNGSVERYTRNVKRWRDGQMIERWVASALVETEKHFRRVRGYRDLPHLVRALDALAPPDSVVADVA